MAIDTKSLTQIITSFRKLQTKDSITTESLGYILQRITDLLATAGESDLVKTLSEWHDNLSKVDHNALFKLQQGPSDRNFVRLSNTFINLLTGQQLTNENATIINQATTERTGAMRAQQVIDLNNARRAIADFEKNIPLMQTRIEKTEKSIEAVKYTPIHVSVEENVLRIYGANKLVSDGYVPYLFRFTRKRNQWKDKVALAAGVSPKKYCAKKKGWNLFGSCYMVKIDNSDVLTFNTNHHYNLCKPSDTYSPLPETLVSSGIRKDGTPAFAWGRSVVSLVDHNKQNRHRMIRLRFAIGFAKKILPGKALVTTANLVSPLAEFSIIYYPAVKTWSFGK